MKHSGYLKGLLSTICILGLVLPAPVYGASLKVKRNVNIRVKNTKNDNLLRAIGSLQPGTVVKIPESVVQQIANSNQDPSNETVLFEWLRRNGELMEFQKYNGEIRRDYFYPVEIVEAKGDYKVAPGTLAYVPIRYLVEKKGLEFVVDQETSIVSADEYKRVRTAIQHLSLMMNKNLQKVEFRTSQSVHNRHAVRGKRFRLKGRCPISLSDLAKEVTGISNKNYIPKEILFSVMQMESAGNCFAERNEGDGTTSIGLFQVNTRSTMVATCNKWQMGQISRAKTSKELRRADLNCLHNPIINLKVAARVLREKYGMVNSRKQPSVFKWNEMAIQARDDWRKALAAYSGGQAYVFQAYYDIKEYSEKTGIELNPHQWETRRVFFFRSLLAKKSEGEFFSSARYNRSLDSTYINIVYVESIAGREIKPVFEQHSIVASWLNKLYFGKRPMSVAQNN